MLCVKGNIAIKQICSFQLQITFHQLKRLIEIKKSLRRLIIR
jgi:hypothetical protein